MIIKLCIDPRRKRDLEKKGFRCLECKVWAADLLLCIVRQHEDSRGIHKLICKKCNNKHKKVEVEKKETPIRPSSKEEYIEWLKSPSVVRIKQKLYSSANGVCPRCSKKVDYVQMKVKLIDYSVYKRTEKIEDFKIICRKCDVEKPSVIYRPNSEKDIINASAFFRKHRRKI